MMMQVEVHLLDYLALRAGCTYLSDLHRPGPDQRARLCRALAELAPDCAPQREWDDAVAYLTGGPPAPGPEAAKAALLDWLAQPHTN